MLFRSNDTATTEIYTMVDTLSLHDALPISMADAIDKAQKPDCRDAYAAMGLLAVVPLVASTAGNGGCRW